MKYLWVLLLLTACDFEQERLAQTAESKKACFDNGGFEYQITAGATRGTCVYRRQDGSGRTE